MSATQTQEKPERRRSREIFEKAEKVLVGGVNSPVRAFKSVGGEPLIIERGSGQYLYDADGNARTGLFTPPTNTFSARSKISRERLRSRFNRVCAVPIFARLN